MVWRFILKMTVHPTNTSTMTIAAAINAELPVVVGVTLGVVGVKLGRVDVII